MLLVALGLLFGVVMLVWCFVLTVTGADSVLADAEPSRSLIGMKNYGETSH